MKTQILIIVLARVLVAVASLVATRCYISILPLDEIGSLTYFLSVTQLCTMFGVYPAGSLFQSIVVDSAKKGCMYSAIKKYYRILVFAGFVAAIGVCVGKAVKVAVIDWSYSTIFVLIFIYQFALPMRETFLISLNILSLNRLYIITNLITAYITILVGVIAIKISPKSQVWLGSTGLIHLLVSIGLGAFLVKRFDWNRDGVIKNAPSVKLFFSSLLLVSLGTWFITDFGKILIDRLAGSTGKDTLGLYTIVVTTGGALVIAVEKLFNDIFGPTIYVSAANKHSNFSVVSGMYLKRLVLTLIFTTLIVTGGQKILVLAIAGNRYIEISQWLILGAMFRASIAIMATCQIVCQATNRPQKLLKQLLLGGIVTAVSVYLGFWLGGTYGGLLGTTISAVFVATASVWKLICDGVVSFSVDDVIDRLQIGIMALILAIILMLAWLILNKKYIPAGLLLLLSIKYQERIRKSIQDHTNWFMLLYQKRYN